MSDKDIIVALRYCTSKTGDFCDMCPYQHMGQKCSERLLKDALYRLRELTTDKKEDE